MNGKENIKIIEYHLTIGIIDVQNWRDQNKHSLPVIL